MNNRGREGQSCADCLYYINASCRRFQPLQVSSPQAMWPRVSPSDWCGEWEPDRITSLKSAIAIAEAEYEVYSKYEPREAPGYRELADGLKAELEALIS